MNFVFQAKLLWQDNRIGWSPNVAYRWLLHHRPGIGTMRFYLYKGDYQVTDSGNIYDDTLKGGRLGLFCFSQEKIIWSNIKYTCSGMFSSVMAAVNAYFMINEMKYAYHTGGRKVDYFLVNDSLHPN